MATIDENKAIGRLASDVEDASRVVDETVADHLSMVSELMSSSPGGMWANRVCALLLYLMHRVNGDAGIVVGDNDDYTTQDNGARLYTSSNGNTMFLRNFADSAYVTFRPANIALGSVGQVIIPVTGSPEGSLAAVVGSIALRTDGGTSTSLYVKESGTGNTGWVAK